MGSLQEFIRKMGDPIDFISHVRAMEQNNTVAQLGNFTVTANGKRYLMTRSTEARIIDFRHFFAALTQTTTGREGFSRTDSGVTELLGVGNELVQCSRELLAWQRNSCFSNEDVSSNFQGASFGEMILSARSENSRETMANMLSRFLVRLGPIPSTQIKQITQNSTGDIVASTLRAIFNGASDLLVSRAY